MLSKKGAQLDNSSSISSCRTPIRHLLLLSKREDIASRSKNERIKLAWAKIYSMKRFA